jgi:hypothetical protein
LSGVSSQQSEISKSANQQISNQQISNQQSAISIQLQMTVLVQHHGTHI